MGGTWGNSYSFSLHIYIKNVSQYHTGQFDSSRLTKPCLYFFFFPGKEGIFKWKLNSKVFRNRNPYSQGTFESLLSGIIVCFNKLVGHLLKQKERQQVRKSKCVICMQVETGHHRVLVHAVQIAILNP